MHLIYAETCESHNPSLSLSLPPSLPSHVNAKDDVSVVSFCLHAFEYLRSFEFVETECLIWK